jgi:YbbR domain-containing protein
MRADKESRITRMMNWFRRKNVGYKVLALFLALFLWYYVSGQRDPVIDRTFTCSIETRALSSQLVLSSPLLSKVHVQVHGVKSIVGSLNDQDVHAYVDLSDQNAGISQVQVKTNVPLGIDIAGIDPQTVKVDLDYWGEKKVPVRLELQGSPASGFMAQTPVINPAEVSVRGPSKLISQIDSVQALLSINGSSNTINQQVPVQIIKVKDEKISVQPSSVAVQVPIVATGAVKTVAVTVDVTGTPANNLVVNGTHIDPASIQITGRADLINSLTTVHTKTIDVSGANGQIIKDVALVLPKGVDVVGVNNVHVIIDIGPVQTNQLPKL